MSKVRGVFPLFLATAFGIGNGLWVFGPEFKAQQEEKMRIANQGIGVEPPTPEVQAQLETLRLAEATASRTSTTESALKPIVSSTSWLPKLSLWSTSDPKGQPPSTSNNITPKTGHEPEKGP